MNGKIFIGREFMALKKVSFRTTEQHRNLRFDQVLTDWLPKALGQPVSKGKVRKLIIAGAAYLNGTRVRIASKAVLPNIKIEVFVDLEKLNSSGPAKDIQFLMTPDRILFEDEDLIVVDKPPGIPTQPTIDEARENLFLSVKKFLAQRAGCSVTEVYLGLHHRLDRDTSGVILFTKSQRANPGVAAIFASHLAVKTYQALAYTSERNSRPEVRPEKWPESWPETWTVKNYLGNIQSQGKRAKFGAVRAGGDFAHTDFKLIQRSGHVLRIEALLHTGRTHQIRVHLSEGGAPLLGDALYGGPMEVNRVKIPRVMLHAAHLTFPHPIHQNRISVHSSIPGDFSQCISQCLNPSSRDLVGGKASP